jgi:uncharacterized protein
LKTFAEQLAALGLLQGVDLQVDQLDEEMRLIPKQISKIEKQITKAQAKLETHQQNLSEYQKKRLKMETELEDAEKRISDDKVKLMNIKTNTEYAALLKEIDNIEKANDERSEDILLLMEQMDQIEMEVKKATLQYNEATQVIEQQATTHKDRLAAIPAEIGKFNKQKASLTADLHKDLVARYLDLRTIRGGLAIVKVNGFLCAGCNMSIPHQVVNRLQRNEELIFCPSCQRILYWAGETRINEPTES